MGTEINKIEHYNFIAQTCPSVARKGSEKGITIPMTSQNEQNYNVDCYKKSQNKKLTAEEMQKYDAIYQKIEKICQEQDIDINLAKSFNLLEKITGVLSPSELVNLDLNIIDQAVNTLENSLGWGDGLGFGKKDIKDLTKLVNDINTKAAYKKTGGSKLGQFVHNIVNKTKSFFYSQTVENCKSAEEIDNYYQKKYLSKIESATYEEKTEIYKELLKDFYYDFNSLKNSEKQVQMVQAIKNLAAKDRLTMVKIIEQNFAQDKEALSLFGKALDMEFESIALSTDAYGQRMEKLEATNVSHIAYRHMTEADITASLDRNQTRAMSFMSENSERITKLREMRSQGIELSPEDAELLAQAECFEARYAGAFTGTSLNQYITDSSRTSLMSRISNDTAEIGIQNAVLETVANFIEKNPQVLLMPKEKFVSLMDSVTSGKYSQTLKILGYTTNKNNYIDDKKITNKSNKSNNSNKEAQIIETEKTLVQQKQNLQELATTQNKTEKVNVNIKSDKNKNLKLANNTNLQNEPLNTTKETQNTSIEDTKTGLPESKTEVKTLEVAVQKGIKAVEEYSETANINSYDLTIEILNMNNSTSTIKNWAFDRFDTWNETQKANNCSRITNNSNKIEAGKHINSVSALKKVDCNNFYVKSEFEELIKKQEEKNPNSNTHLSTQKSFC